MFSSLYFPVWMSRKLLDIQVLFFPKVAQIPKHPDFPIEDRQNTNSKPFRCSLMIKSMKPSYRSLSGKAKSSWSRNQRQCFDLGYRVGPILKISRWAPLL
jgi:hypothetical protein